MLEVKPCKFGVGVFATQDIAADTKVCDVVGKLIDYATSAALGDRECDPLQIGPDLYLAWEDPARLINHACEPNCGIRFDGTKYDMFAVKNIAKGEELLWDYSNSMGDDETWRLECGCGSPNCRAVVGPFSGLPAETQRTYRKLGIVLPFLCG